VESEFCIWRGGSAYTKYYGSAKHVAADEIICILKQYVQNVMRICELCDSVEYIYSKVLYADKHRTTHASVTVLTLRTENVGQKIFSSSSVIFDDSHTRTTHCCTSVRQNWEVLSKNLRKTPQLKWTWKWMKKLCF